MLAAPEQTPVRPTTPTLPTLSWDPTTPAGVVSTPPGPVVDAASSAATVAPPIPPTDPRAAPPPPPVTVDTAPPVVSADTSPVVALPVDPAVPPPPPATAANPTAPVEHQRGGAVAVCGSPRADLARHDPCRPHRFSCPECGRSGTSTRDGRGERVPTPSGGPCAERSGARPGSPHAAVLARTTSRSHDHRRGVGGRTSVPVPASGGRPTRTARRRRPRASSPRRSCPRSAVPSRPRNRSSPPVATWTSVSKFDRPTGRASRRGCRAISRAEIESAKCR